MQPIAADIAAIQSRLEAHKEQKNESKVIQCRNPNCGVNNHFSPNQWRIRCICGAIITRSTKGTGQQDKPIYCKLCDGTGVLTYDAQYDENIYSFAARCTCVAGEKHTELVPVMQAENAPGWLIGEIRGDVEPVQGPWANKGA
jgi:ribosomal protein S27E